MKIIGATAICLIVVAWCTSAPAAESAPRLLYTRADVVESTAGEATLQRAYTRTLELPSSACDTGPFTCVKEQQYGQVYSINFMQYLATRGPDGKATIDRRDRGRVTIAISLTKELEDQFEDSLHGYLDRVSVDQYQRPWAGAWDGMRINSAPIDQAILQHSTAPAWVCRFLDDAYGIDVLVNTDQGESSYSRAGLDSEAACRTIEGVVKDEAPESIRTLPSVQAQIRREVHLSSSSTLSGLTWANRLASIPDGATFKKRRLEGAPMTGGLRDRRDGVYRGHEGRYGAVERDVRLPRAALDLTEVPMWVMRWSFDATREQFGSEPRREPLASNSLDVALVPIVDPSMEGLERTRTELSVPDERVIAAVLARLARSSDLGPSQVGDALADPETWPSGGDWIVVTCRDDGSARYGIAPFAEAAEVANPREVCDAIRRVLER